MITIKVKFKAAVMGEGIMKTVKEKSHFVKPCLKKRLKREEAQRQRKKSQMKLIRQIENEEKEWHR